MGEVLTYQNRGAMRTARITEHARCRFIVRWKRVFAWKMRAEGYADGIFDPAYRDAIDSGEVARIDAVIAGVFAKARKLPQEKFDRRLKKRDRRHGGHARFRVRPFDFIIQNGALVTVELQGDESIRSLNTRGETELPVAA